MVSRISFHVLYGRLTQFPKYIDFASELLERYETIHSAAVLMAMSQNYPRRNNFWDDLKDYLEYEGTELDNAWEEMLHSRAWSHDTCGAVDGFRQREERDEGCVCVFCIRAVRGGAVDGFRQREERDEGCVCVFCIRAVSLRFVWFQFLFLKAALSFMEKRYMDREDAALLLFDICWKISLNSDPNRYHHNYNNALFEATRQNASDVVQKMNYVDETPEVVFTREHKDLVSEGEKWMKTTPESYTITAGLITTIVFATAITVPGGNNQDSGIPIFTNSVAFITFAVADAISLFTAVTSLLMFLSIITTRFAEQD
nr:ankyrin repeat-containing domain, PGG domain protein [Tanacetum cinerariifolium]